MLIRLLIRVPRALMVLLGTAIVTFFIMHAVPADPARVIAGSKADPQTLAQVRADLHLDEPVIKQLGRYLWRLGHGDLGMSYVTKESVAHAILTRFPATAALAILALVWWMVLAVPLGVLTARYRDSMFDRTVLVLGTTG